MPTSKHQQILWMHVAEWLLQESVDSQKALVFTTWYKEIMEKGRDDKELLDKALDRVMSLSDSKKEKELRGNLNEQVQRLFEFIHEATEKGEHHTQVLDLILVYDRFSGDLCTLPSVSDGYWLSWHDLPSFCCAHSQEGQSGRLGA